MNTINNINAVLDEAMASSAAAGFAARAAAYKSALVGIERGYVAAIVAAREVANETIAANPAAYDVAMAAYNAASVAAYDAAEAAYDAAYKAGSWTSAIIAAL